MERGFALIKDENNNTIKSITDTAKVNRINVKFYDGSVNADLEKK